MKEQVKVVSYTATFHTDIRSYRFASRSRVDYLKAGVGGSESRDFSRESFVRGLELHLQGHVLGTQQPLLHLRMRGSLRLSTEVNLSLIRLFPSVNPSTVQIVSVHMWSVLFDPIFVLVSKR